MPRKQDTYFVIHNATTNRRWSNVSFTTAATTSSRKFVNIMEQALGRGYSESATRPKAGWTRQSDWRVRLPTMTHSTGKDSTVLLTLTLQQPQPPLLSYRAINLSILPSSTLMQMMSFVSSLAPCLHVNHMCGYFIQRHAGGAKMLTAVQFVHDIAWHLHWQHPLTKKWEYNILLHTDASLYGFFRSPEQTVIYGNFQYLKLLTSGYRRIRELQLGALKDRKCSRFFFF